MAELVTIEKAELERLRKLEADLPAMLEKVRADRDAEKLQELHQRDKENPEQARKRAMNRYNLKKEEINAKRREAYRLKKAENVPGSSPVEN